MITIVLPFPYPQLSPNYRPKHWSEKADAIARYRHECMVEALAVRNRRSLVATDGVRTVVYDGETERVLPLDVTITFILKDKRRHDWDNLLASFKAGIDGLVDAGLLPDDDIRSYSPTLRYEQGPKAAVRVELQ